MTCPWLCTSSRKRSWCSMLCAFGHFPGAGLLCPSFCHSGAQCTAPGLAFKSPSVALLPALLTAVRNHSSTRRGGAQPHTAQPGPVSKRGPNCLGNHPRLFQSGALFRTLPRITVMTLEGCFCECVDLIVSLDLLPGQVFDAT